MEDQLKHRVVGAVVIFALAAIFLPLVLDSRKSQERFDSRIPERPALSTAEPVAVKGSIQRQQQTGDEGSEETGATRPISDRELEAQGQEQAGRDGLPADVDTDDAGSDTATGTEAASEEPVADSAQENSVQAPPETGPAGSDGAAGKVDERSAPVTESQFRSNAWVIQIGSFSNADNANKLVAELKGKGYKAFARPRPVAGKKVTRVFIGPHLREAEANRIMEEVGELTGMKPLVVKFDPSRH